MLAERHRELLTAYVDGELSNRQRKQVLRLLRRSSEARVLLRKMQDDSDCLRRLPRQRLSDEFSLQVLQSVHDLQLPPIEQTIAAAPQQQTTLPTWTGVLAALVVLVFVGIGSYFYFARFVQPDANRPSQPAPAANK